MTTQQREILSFLKAKGGRITLASLVDAFGANYHCNAESHVGAICSRMVKAGLLKREKPGVFSMGDGKKKDKLPEKECHVENVNQIKLFEV